MRMSLQVLHKMKPQSSNQQLVEMIQPNLQALILILITTRYQPNAHNKNKEFVVRDMIGKHVILCLTQRHISLKKM